MPQFKVKDNRELEILDNGITSDKAIIFHHGTPHHASAWSSWLEEAASRGIRALSYSRAGYGTSDRNFGRSVLSNNSDISLLLDGKNISSFVAIGWSGGGPHALANTFDHRNVGAITLAFFGEDVIVMIDFGPVNGPSLISTAQVRSPLVNTRKLVLAFVAVTVVQPALGYSDWKNA